MTTPQPTPGVYSPDQGTSGQGDTPSVHVDAPGLRTLTNIVSPLPKGWWERVWLGAALGWGLCCGIGGFVMMCVLMSKLLKALFA